MLVPICFPLAGLALQISTRHVRDGWRVEDIRLRNALHVRRIEPQPAAAGGGMTNVMLKLNNGSAKSCEEFSVELSWSGGEGGPGGRETRDFKLPVATGQEVTLPLWQCPVAAGKDLVWTARVVRVKEP